jgi:hypothetical protein
MGIAKVISPGRTGLHQDAIRAGEEGWPGSKESGGAEKVSKDCWPERCQRVVGDVWSLHLILVRRSSGSAVPHCQSDPQDPADVEHRTEPRAMVVRHHPETGERHLDLLKWGLLPYFTKEPVHAKRPINARAETVATSGMFRPAFAKRRCVVRANAFSEWKAIEGGTQPFAIARQDRQLMAFAELWEGSR